MTETNSRADKLSIKPKRKLKCSVCAPNRGCNASTSQRKRHAGQKPKYKDKRKGKA